MHIDSGPSIAHSEEHLWAGIMPAVVGPVEATRLGGLIQVLYSGRFLSVMQVPIRCPGHKVALKVSYIVLLH